MLSAARRKWIVVFLAFAVPLIYAAYTQHVWEDFFITLKSSRNLVEGNGLVYTPGDRLHTFTSPLGVLVPAGCYWLAGSSHEDGAIWLYRMLNAVCLASAAGLVFGRFRTLKVGLAGFVVFFGLVLFDAKLTEYAIDGMETAILAYFVCLLWSELEREEGFRIGVVAVACAGLEWTRPDAFILGGALILAHFIFRGKGAQVQPRRFGAIARAIAVSIVLYVPWLIWAWWYYGSPVPHTIVAKAQFSAPVHLGDLLTVPWRTLIGTSLLGDLFLPIYWVYGSWLPWLPVFGAALAIVAAFAWLLPPLAVKARRASFAVFVGMFYVCSIILFPWYCPAWAVIAFLAIALTVDQAWTYGREHGLRWLNGLLTGALAAVFVIQAGIFVATAAEMHVQQRLIENGVRRDIGRWLNRTAAPGDSVFLEPLGYIGYYSRLKMYDFPGLSSSEVVRAIHAGNYRFTEVIATLKPTWLVLRPFEVADSRLPQNAALRDYELVRTWDVHPQLAAEGFVPGRGWLEHDSEFKVFHRKTRP